jgi:hypothetical protein
MFIFGLPTLLLMLILFMMAGCSCHRYIMTSPTTHSQLQQLLQDHYYFGLCASQVHLFECTVAPPAFAGEPLKAITLGAATLTRGAPGDIWCSMTGWQLTPLQLFMMYSCDI